LTSGMNNEADNRDVLKREADVLPRTDYDLIQAHGHAALITVLISTIFGILVATKFTFPDFMGGHAWETWGRLRYNHTQGIFFGWLGNAFIAFCYYVVPRLTNRPVTSRALGWTIFWIWNCAVVLPGWVLVCAGFSQPLEWAEFPMIVDVFVILAFILMLIEFVRPFLRVSAGSLYVTGWYIVGGLVFTTLAYPIGNLVPELMPGAQGAAFSGLWIHDAVGLFVTPLAVAMSYYVIPAATGKPIYSHFLSMLGFWLLFFIYPLNGTHHYVYSAIPMSAQRGAVMASVYLGLDVILVVTNLLLSLRGSSAKIGSDVALRFTWFGVVAYLVVSIQGSVQAIMPINSFIHFSDWVIGHSHLAMIGFASFTAAGALAHMWSRMPGVRYNRRAMEWAFWLLTVGLAIMVVDLTSAGLVEGQLWVSHAPWIDSVRAVYPFWLTRILAGLPIIAGFLLFWIGLCTGPRNANALASTRLIPNEDRPDPAREITSYEYLPAAAPSVLSRAYSVAFIAGFGFFVLSFVVLGIIPARELQKEIRRTAPRSMQPLTEAEQHGREIYGREGCAYCHTEQVRYVVADVERFGAPTAAWETQYDYPQLWGTRRIGPDLAREYGLRTSDWQFTHLFNPRATVPDSIMPAFSWMFDGSPDKPNHDAMDLVAYLRSLGRERALAGDADAPANDASESMNMNGAPMQEPEPDTRQRIVQGGLDSSAPVVARTSSLDSVEVSVGFRVFQHNCSGCHGANAAGDGIAYPGLLPHPLNLSTEHFSDAHLAAILWDGVAGTSMPAWRELNQNDIKAVAEYVLSVAAKQALVKLSSPESDDGAKLYNANCVSCHGESGAGDGPAAGAIEPAPANFHVTQPSETRAWTVLEQGVPGTAMPAWKQLAPDQRHLLVRYVQSFYDEEQEQRRK
jgi:cytochrome c oxidase cbb3-type subunit I/II